MLLDVLLPSMDGFAICVEQRKRSQVPIVLFTALSRIEDVVQGFKVGGDDYIVKAALISEVVDRVRAVLRRGPSPKKSSVPAALR